MLRIRSDGTLAVGPTPVIPMYDHKDLRFTDLVMIPGTRAFLVKSEGKVYRGWVNSDHKSELVEIPDFGTDNVVGSGDNLAFQTDNIVDFYDVIHEIRSQIVTEHKCIFHNDRVTVFFGNDTIMINYQGRSFEIPGFDQAIVYNHCASSRVIRMVAKNGNRLACIKHVLGSEFYEASELDYELEGTIKHVVYDPGNRRVVRVVSQKGSQILNGSIVYEGIFVYGCHNHVIFRNLDGELEVAY